MKEETLLGNKMEQHLEVRRRKNRQEDKEDEHIHQHDDDDDDESASPLGKLSYLSNQNQLVIKWGRGTEKERATASPLILAPENTSTPSPNASAHSITIDVELLLYITETGDIVYINLDGDQPEQRDEPSQGGNDEKKDRNYGGTRIETIKLDFISPIVDVTNFFEQSPALKGLFVKVPPSNISSISPSTNKIKMYCVTNPAAGVAVRGEDFESCLHRIVESLGDTIEWISYQTQSEGDGARIGRDILEHCKSKSGSKEEPEQDLQIAVIGGDGTIHELLNGILLDENEDIKTPKQRINLILFPFGTANALYHHLFPPESRVTGKDVRIDALYSLVIFLRWFTSLRSRGTTRKSTSTTYDEELLSLKPLQTALNTLPSSPHKVITSVVSSAALHASILYDAEALRKTVPGVERFKVAAMQNATHWTKGTLDLYPSPASLSQGSSPCLVTRYNSRTRQWVQADQEAEQGEGGRSRSSSGSSTSGKIRLEGPFSYFVSALVSRFESNFVVAPLRSPNSPLGPFPQSSLPFSPASTTKSNIDVSAATPTIATFAPSIDVIVIRPLRDPQVRQKLASSSRDGNTGHEEEEAAKMFVNNVWKVTGGMYDGGKHIDAVYQSTSSSPHDSLPVEVVEYYRCHRFIWTPSTTTKLPIADNSSDLKEKVNKDLLVCLDGAIRNVGDQGGQLITQALDTHQTRLQVWA